MKKIISLLIILISFSSIAQDNLIFATHTRPPLSLYLKEVLIEALQPHSISVEVIEMPGSRVISHVNSGDIDGDIARVGNFKEVSDANTSNYLRVDEPVVLIEIVMITLADKEVTYPISWENINQGNVAFQRGSKTMRKYIDKHNRFATSSSIQVLEMVANKRVDSAIMFSSVAKDLLNKNSGLQEKLVIQTPAVMSFPLYVYLNQKHAELLPKLENSLRQLKINGIIEKIAQKYQITLTKFSH